FVCIFNSKLRTQNLKLLYMMGATKYTKPDLVTLLDELHVFCALVELRIQTAQEPATETKKPPQV
ncbi:MAG: hypothetical protein NTX36_06980, partial [Proteobacteria bacterium]|nr:hypothetical protein [Pseudomonadota bacterium]